MLYLSPYHRPVYWVPRKRANTACGWAQNSAFCGIKLWSLVMLCPCILVFCVCCNICWFSLLFIVLYQNYTVSQKPRNSSSIQQSQDLHGVTETTQQFIHTTVLSSTRCHRNHTTVHPYNSLQIYMVSQKSHNSSSIQQSQDLDRLTKTHNKWKNQNDSVTVSPKNPQTIIKTT